MRDKIINLHSSSVNNKDTLKKALIGNQSNADQNMLQGEIAVVNTPGEEAIYTLSSDGTDMIEFSPISKEEKSQISSLITNGNEVFVGPEAPTGNETVWIDTDENPDFSTVAITEAPKDGNQYARQDGTWSIVSGGSTQYLDLSMFSESSGTLSDEDYQKVVKAYEDKVIIGYMDKMYSNLVITNEEGVYFLMLTALVPDILIVQKSISINPDKSYISGGRMFSLLSDGSGTKALTDNGQYVEFAPEAPKDGNQYARQDGAWSAIDVPDVSGLVTKDQLLEGIDGKVLSANDFTDELKNKLDGISENADAVSISRSLTGGTKVGTITINGTATDLYCQTNTDTHYTTHLYATTSAGTADAATTNGNTYLRVFDNTTARDSVKIAGSGATSVSSDSSGNITISSTNTTYSVVGASGSTGLVKNGSSVTSTSGYTACPIISGVPYYKDTNTTYTLSSFGVTATAAELNKLDGCTATVTELNYVDGVTSNIQTQLNNKANTSTVLTKTNTTSYTPTSDYHPATKKYVDDEVSKALTKYKILSESEYTALGTSVNTDNILYFVTPDA